ncbi:ABC transporter permease [Streptomyces sp. TP-A0874]|uniref:ABC transporter permease n=1 Tax=Streptomyces sp. TP-A0874 TaxID=549819 RepID=UPI000852952B|nr:ABC transporter permease [Streptomyces sp. TP-A0874]
MSDPTTTDERPHRSQPRPRRLLGEVRAALSSRGLLLICGALLLQLAFILSYIGAFHSPTPHKIPVAVVAPTDVSGQVVQQLNDLDGTPVEARPAESEAAARASLLDRSVDAAILVNPRGATDTLLVASAGGPAVAASATEIAENVEASQGRQVTTEDILPPAPGDSRGMSPFYLAIGWIVGGYLAAAILGIAGGARPKGAPHTAVRLGVLAVYAVVSGLGGAIIADPVLGALTGHFGALWALGVLTVYAAAVTTVALQALLGLLGVGVAILVFVVLGNPSAGGVYPSSLLPPFWRALGDHIPTGAATSAIRDTVYFPSHTIDTPLTTLAVYTVASILVTFLAASRRAKEPLPGNTAEAPKASADG